jgi:hypothetical protein
MRARATVPRKAWKRVAVGALALAMACAVLADHWLRPYDLAKERTAARAAGIPLSSVELQRPEPAPGQDAVPEWLALADLLTRKPLDEKILDAVDGAASLRAPMMLPGSEEAQRLLAARPDVSALIQRIASRSAAYFPHTWRVGEEYPYALSMRRAGGILRLESLELARAGRYDEAVRRQALGFRIADHAAMDPIVVSYLVGANLECVTLQGLQAILQMAGPDARIAGAVRRAIEAHPSRLDLAAVMRADSLFALTELRKIRSFDDYYAVIDGASIPLVYMDPPPPPVSPGPPSRPNALVRRYLAEPGEAAYLHAWIPVVRAALMPEHERVAAARKLQGARAENMARAPGAGLANIFEFVFAKSFTRGLEAAACRRVTLASARVMEHCARSGRCPERLESVMSPVPSDPFAGKPLSYRRERGGFVVYSVGDAVAERQQPIAFHYAHG